MIKKKILHIAFDDFYGAGKSAFVLNKYLNIHDHFDSKLLVFKKLSKDKNVFEVKTKEKIFQKIYEKIANYVTFGNKSLASFCYFKNSSGHFR